MTVTVGEPPGSFNFGIAPTLLPPADPGAGRLDIDIEDQPSTTGQLPPPMSELTIGLDRSIQLEPLGLPICGWAQHPRLQIENPMAGCSQAVIGRFVGEIVVAFPEEVPIHTPVSGKIYNGGRQHGAAIVGLRMLVSAPVLGALRLLMKVRSVHDGRIGSQMTVKIPEIVGGSGVLTRLDFELGRAFNRGGERAGYVNATCPDGKLLAAARATYVDGTSSEVEATRACTRRGRRS